MEFTKEQQEKGQELYKEIVAKAWENANFKESLVKNPMEAIKEVMGEDFELPENKKLVVLDQSDDDTIYLNIPKKISVDDLELTEEQLEAVSGGLVISGTIALYALGVAAFGAGVALYAAVKN